MGVPDRCVSTTVPHYLQCVPYTNQATVIIPSPLSCLAVFFLFRPWQAGKALLPDGTPQLLESGIRAVQCYNYPTAQCGSGHDT